MFWDDITLFTDVSFTEVTLRNLHVIIANDKMEIIIYFYPYIYIRENSIREYSKLCL